MPGPNPRFSKVNPRPDEYKNKTLGIGKPIKKVEPKPRPKKMKKGGRA